MKTAQASAQKFADRAAASTQTYTDGVAQSTKDQAAAAIAAASIWAQATAAAAARGSFAKGLQKSGSAGWKKGVAEKGGGRYGEGVSGAGPKYATNSAPFDSARNASASMPRGLKGSPQNLQKVATVVAALVKAKQA